MKITSPAFENDAFIPAKYACDGENVNPPLYVSGTPEEAKSLVLIVDDQDVPGTWVHWTLWNIRPETQAIPEHSVPAGSVQGTPYSGPCAPSGTHHYFFKAYALDTVLDLPTTAEAGDLESAMSGHIIDKAGLIGLYDRTRQ